MKNLFILIGFVILTSGCAVFRPGNTPSAEKPSEHDPSTVHFINDISVNPSSAAPSRDYKTVPVERAKRTSAASEKTAFNTLQLKYAILTDMPYEQLTNRKLLEFMDSWYGVKYQYGGTSMEGIDCSAFASLLMSEVYQVNLPRVSRDQYMACIHITKSNLQEGDLVFFHTFGKGRKITHVGVYLYNNKFIHASVSGVMISDLSEGYYAQHLVGSGRAEK